MNALVIAGSTRELSFNKVLAKLAHKHLTEMGVQSVWVDLRDYAMPLYDGDLESKQGLPSNAVRLRQQMQQADALVFASPEYNGSLSAVLKNTIDWLSRPNPEKINPFSAKAALLMSASPGALGGIRGLKHLRDVLDNLGVLTLPSLVSISAAHTAFDESGNLVDPKAQARLSQGLSTLIELQTKRKAA